MDKKKFPLLTSITSPKQIQGLSLEELSILAQEIRAVIIETVSKTGGHLAPSLGVVELTLAMLNIFDPAQDKFIWDVGHQAYCYKILTRGLKQFKTLRQLGGISGFPRLSESPYDHFGVGHSSTSISAGLGMAVARDLAGRDFKVLAIIGDGSMTAGLAYEGLNQAGDLDRDLIVILNDNEMSISKNVGALSSFLSRHLIDQRVIKLKKEVKKRLKQIPKIGEELAIYAKKSEGSLKSFFTPGMLFEAFKFNYLGPLDGHNLSQLTKTLAKVKQLAGPVLLHIMTTKGKGYQPAEQNPTYFHGVGQFEPENGTSLSLKKQNLPTYSEVFGHTMINLAQQDDKVIAITAAMPEGTGLNRFQKLFPKRFFDVGICEQHAVTFAAGLACQGFKPVVCIYSTFLQRSYDQIIHDVCLQGLHVIFCLDRGGLVGEDGATHHGAFDLSYLRHIPNLTLMAPKDEPELQDMLYTALKRSGPVAIRFPRGTGPGHPLKDHFQLLPKAQGELLHQGTDILVIAVGSRVYPALQAITRLEAKKIASCALYNLRFIKPLPKTLGEVVKNFQQIVIVEENVLAGGAGSAILEFLTDQGLLKNKHVKRLGLPDKFIEHGTLPELRKMTGIDTQGIYRVLKGLSN